MFSLRSELGNLRKSRMAMNAGWMLLAQGSSLVLQATYFIFLAKLLGVTEYGILAGAVALVSITYQYAGAGSGTVFLRYVSADPLNYRAYWGNVLLSTLLSSSLLVFAMVVFGRSLIGASAASLLLPLGIGYCFLNKLSEACGQVFQAFEQMRPMAVLTFLTNALRLALAMTLFYATRHVSARFWALTSLLPSLIVATAGVCWVTRKFGTPALHLGLVAKTVKEGIGYSFAGSTALVYNDVDKTILSHNGMNQANGIYSMVYRVIEIAWLPTMSVHLAARPSFFRIGAHGLSETRRLSRRILRRTVPLCLMCAAVMFLAAPSIPLVVGRGFQESVQALRWLCLIPLFRCFQFAAGEAIMGAGMQSYRTAVQLSGALLNLGLNLMLIPKYSWRGAAWSSLVTDGALGVAMWIMFEYLLRRSPKNVDLKELPASLENERG
jgi:O-antigen/teichoic acid export membrane protein